MTLSLVSLLFVFVVVAHGEDVESIDPVTVNVDIEDCVLRALSVNSPLAVGVLKLEAELLRETVLRAEFVEVGETTDVDEGIETVDTGEVEAER